jgi:hypothetical protein
VRTWNFTDGCGNTSANFVQTITVQDTTAPQITVQALVNCYETEVLAKADVESKSSAFDNCDGPVTPVVTLKNGGGTATLVYTVAAVDGCGNEATRDVTVHLLPTASISYVGSPYCATGTATVTQSGQGGGTYGAAPSGLNLNPRTGAIDMAASAVGSYTVTYTFSNGTCNNSASAGVTVLPQPGAPIATAQTFCSGSNPTVANLVASGSNLQWYDVASGGSVLPETVALGSGTYYVSQTMSGCESSRTAVSVTVDEQSIGGTALATESQVCNGSTTEIMLTGHTGAILRWQSSIDGVIWSDISSTAMPLSTRALTQTTQFRAVLQNGTCGTVNSTVAIVAVSDPVGAQPLSSADACPGPSTTFTAVATGTGPYDFAWKFNDSALASGGKYTITTSGATSTLKIDSVTATDQGPYSITVGGSCGAPVTQMATLTVKQLARVAPLDPVTVCPGSSATYTAVASGTGRFDFAWQLGNSSIVAGGKYSIGTSGNTSTLTINNTSDTDAGVYGVTVTGDCGDPVTQTATLTVNQGVALSSLDSTHACAGSNASFSSTASGTGPYEFSWKFENTEIQSGSRYTITSVGNTSTLTLNGVTPADAGDYTVAVNGTCSSDNRIAHLTVTSPPEVTVPAVATCPGVPVTLAAVHNAGPDATFHWTPGGATTPEIQVPGIANATYTVRVTTSSGCFTEASGVVVVGDGVAPVITQGAADQTVTASGCQAAVPDFTQGIVATDDCAAPGQLRIAQAPTAGTLVGVGITPVTVTVRDAVGNSATSQAKLTVIASLPSITINDASIIEGNSGTTDAVFTVTLSQPRPPISSWIPALASVAAR